MPKILGLAADAVGDAISSISNAFGGGRMKTGIHDPDGVIAKLLAGQKADQEAKNAQAGQLAQAAQIAPTVSQPTMKKGGKVKKADGGSVYTEKMGKPPQDVDGASVRKSSKRDQPEQLGEGIRIEKRASGGMTGSSASRRGDGIAVKGKTRGRML
jgi:hypothetical protein